MGREGGREGGGSLVGTGDTCGGDGGYVFVFFLNVRLGGGSKGVRGGISFRVFESVILIVSVSLLTCVSIICRQLCVFSPSTGRFFFTLFLSAFSSGGVAGLVGTARSLLTVDDRTGIVFEIVQDDSGERHMAPR